MALYPNYFYHGLIKKYINIFGNVFNNIKIRQSISSTQTKEIVVPILWAQKKKYVQRLREDVDILKEIAITLPKMSYEIVGYNIDTERKLNRVNNIKIFNGNTVNKILSPIPYNFIFDLSLFVKNKDDGYQVIEQILPFFNSDLTISVENMIDGLSHLDLNLVLNAVNEEDTYDGNYETLRTIQWTLSFTLKGYLFTPSIDSSGKLIKKVILDFYDDSVANSAILEQYEVYPGLTSNGEPSSNSSNTINYQLINYTDDYGYIIEKTESI